LQRKVNIFLNLLKKYKKSPYFLLFSFDGYQFYRGYLLAFFVSRDIHFPPLFLYLPRLRLLIDFCPRFLVFLFFIKYLFLFIKRIDKAENS
jgi:hypothetical protein